MYARIVDAAKRLESGDDGMMMKKDKIF